jgi:hypothetical protein
MSWRLPLGIMAGRGGGPTGPVDVAATSPETLTTNLVLWLKADSYVGADGDAVATWGDSSGNARDATQATAGKKPTYKTNIWNSLPVMRFDGGDGLGTAAVDLTASRVMTWYMVASATDQTNQILMEFSDNTNNATTDAGGFLLADTASRLSMTVKGNVGANDWTSLNTFEQGTGTAKVIHGIFDMTLSKLQVVNGLDGDTTGRHGSNVNVNTGLFGNHPFNIGCRDADASVAATSLFLTGDIAEVIVYTGRHTAAQRWGVERYLAEKYNVTAWSKPLANLVFEGDSITEGGNSYFTTAYPQRLVNRLKDKVAWFNPAISGQRIDGAVADASTQIYPESAFSNFGSKNIATCWLGTNDMINTGGNQTAAATLTEYYSYLDALTAQSFKTLAFTVIPRNDAGAPADFEAKRLAFNADVLANYASHAFAVCDPTTNAAFDVEADTLDTTYYDADLVHPNTTGLRVISGIVGATLSSAYSVDEIVPSDLTGLVAWWDANAITPVADGTAIAQWDDSSGNAKHATQATGTKQPVYKTSILNGKPVVRFQGTDDFMDVPAIDLSATKAITVIGVFNSTVNATDQVIIEMSANYGSQTDSFILYRASDNLPLFGAEGNVGFVDAKTAFIQSAHAVFAGVIDMSKALREVSVWKNGTFGTLGNNSNNTGFFGNRALYMGARAGTSLFLTGDIAELMIFNRALTGGERGRMEEYLAYKWGIF